MTVANLRDDKNYPGLIEAARLVVERGAPVRFATAGQGPLEAQIRELRRRSGLGERFALLGYRDDATRLIAAADLFVLASHHEGLPVTVMEALTLGVPVVAPAVGGLPEVVTSGTQRHPRRGALGAGARRRHRASRRTGGARAPRSWCVEHRRPVLLAACDRARSKPPTRRWRRTPRS